MTIKNEYIGVKEFDLFNEAVHGRVSELLGEGEPETFHALEDYKSAFETLAKHIRGWAEAHNDGSLLLSLVMESAKDDNEDAFFLIQNALSKKVVTNG
ncbi:hypothetical protein [Bacillus weihaiensis]|uniref:hypothetical protein n=1 Tax=Bacillus weihaiensis TaxID=1547283 RepID=UPI002355EECA|nr:hypothetical protein [Bacillus weihaiensis]